MRSLLLAVVAVRVRAGAVAVVDEAEGRVPVLYKIMESAKLARPEGHAHADQRLQHCTRQKGARTLPEKSWPEPWPSNSPKP
jgi:hypothetical protein